MRRLLILPLLSVLLACPAGDDADDCAYLVGKTFLSDDELECGPSPNGAALCHWEVSFTAAAYTYSYSDLSEMNPYTCEGGAITAEGRTGTIDAATGKLVWDDVAYTVAP